MRGSGSRAWIGAAVAAGFLAVVTLLIGLVTNVVSTLVPESFVTQHRFWVWVSFGVLFVLTVVLTVVGVRLATNTVSDSGSPPAEPPQIVLGNIPGEPPAFVDRIQLGDLAAAFATHRRTVICAGGRGVGKTQLAAAYARDRQANHWPLIVWVNAETSDTIREGLVVLAERVNVADPEGDSERSAVRAREYLNARHEDTLLIFDNATDPAIVYPLLPISAHCRVLITTDNQAFTEIGESVPVGVYTPDQAITYLDRRTKLGDPVGARRVATELGLLPLALAQAAAFMANHHLDYHGYLDRLSSVPVAELLPATAAGYPRGAAEAILLSITTAEGASPAIAPILRMMSVLDPNGIERDLLTQLLPELDTDRAGSVLTQASLTQWTQRGDTITIHRLIARVIRDRDIASSRLGESLASASSRLERLLTSNAVTPANHGYVRSVASHITALVRHTEALEPVDVDHIRCVASAGFASVHLLGYMSDYGRARDLSVLLTECCVRLLGGEHIETLRARGNLARWTGSAGEAAKARDLFIDLLPDMERILGREHLETLRARGNLARWTGSAGEAAKARDLFIDLLAEMERVLGPDQLDRLTARRSLATWTGSAGDAVKARDLFIDLLPDMERALGRDHPETLRARSKLARWTGSAGDAAKARDLFIDLLPDMERVLGPDHSDTLHARSNLARWTGAAGEPSKARDLFTDLLADTERVLGPDHPGALITRRSLTYWTRRQMETSSTA